MQNEFFYKDPINREAEMLYLVSVPDDFDREEEKLPMIVFLNGAGERGRDGALLKRHGVPKYFDGASPVRAVTLSPQCPDGMVWDNIIFAVKRLIDKTAAEYNADMDRISITGLSMGGYGTWAMICNYPDYFSCAAPICGGGMTWMTGGLTKLPIWAFHGEADETVECTCSELMVKRIRSNGGNVKFTVYPGVYHDCWERAYEKENLFEWLIDHKRH